MNKDKNYSCLSLFFLTNLRNLLIIFQNIIFEKFYCIIEISSFLLNMSLENQKDIIFDDPYSAPARIFGTFRENRFSKDLMDFTHVISKPSAEKDKIMDYERLLEDSPVERIKELSFSVDEAASTLQTS